MSLSIAPIADAETRLTKDAVHVWHADLNLASPNAVGILSLLDREERARAARLRDDVDRCQYIAAHSMARILIASYLGCKPGAVRFGHAPRGKPYVIRTDGDVDLRFNVSRTKDFAIFAVSVGREVGVDAENIGFDHRLVDVAPRAFTERERAIIDALPSKAERYAGYLRAWARKEAYLKACGVGLAIAPADVDTEANFGTIYLRGKLQQIWRVYDVAVGDRYSAAVAAEGETWQVILRKLNI